MESITHFFNKEVQLTEISNLELVDRYDEKNPIVMYNEILKKIKEKSNKAIGLTEQIETAEYLKRELEILKEKLNIKLNHFSINTEGSIIVTTFKKGQHYLAPTHFETGAYLSLPHFDHMLNCNSEGIPKLHIGKYTRIGKNAAINAGGDIFIGDYVWLAPGSTLLRQEHNAYGQPSIAARSVAMTKQPSIYIENFAWVGKDALVGWEAQYTGKCSIVGSRSFINKWVGDYSVVGDHSKILKYLPYKGYFMEYYKPNLKELLKVTNWEKINEEWLEVFNKVDKKSKEIEVQKRLKEKKHLRILLLNTKNHKILENINIQNQTDILLLDSKQIPFYLQKAEYLNNYRVRVRKISTLENIPLEDCCESFRKENGYDYVITNKVNKDVLKEIQRIIKKDGEVIELDS